MADPTDIERQIPLIMYRLDTTAQVLEDIKLVLNKQTENLTSFMVLQEKHNNLQISVREVEAKLAVIDADIEVLKDYKSKLTGGFATAIFLFAILQSIFVWYISAQNSKIDQIETLSRSNNDKLYIVAGKLKVQEDSNAIFNFQKQSITPNIKPK
jgi:uncharacterized membrane protein affecting hemolysin expression